MSRLRTGRRGWALVVVVLVAAVIADRNGWLLVRRPADMAAYHGVTARVGRVIDGDTIEIELGDRVQRRPVTKVRLLGVDCPELAGPNRPAAPGAEEARALTRSLVEERPVLLTLEPHRTRGDFGRLLAHVRRADGSSLNEALLVAGLARADERWPHALIGRYAHLERAARQEGVGMWGAD